MQVDDTDRRILRRLQANPSLSTADLAALAGVTATTCARRIDRMTREGIIQGQHAVINWAALGFEVEVSLRFTLDKTDPRAFDEFLASARAVPEVTEIQTFLGRVDLRLHIVARDMAHYQKVYRIVARDMAHYQKVYRERILTLPHIADIEALMQVSTLKHEEALPL